MKKYKKLVKQTHNDLNEKIQLYGCRFRCLQAMVEVHLDSYLKPAQINKIYDIARDDPTIINNNCLCGRDEHKVTDLTSQLLGGEKVQFRQAGVYRDNRGIDWTGQGTYLFDYILNHWATNTSDGHYTLSNAKNELIFDPLGLDPNKNNVLRYIKRQFIYKRIEGKKNKS